MNFDVIYITYNSEKWIRPCFSSWENEEFKNSVNIIVVDNGSIDGTLEVLEEIKCKMGPLFASFRIVAESENHGFGLANNIAASYGKSDFVCFLNIDTEIQNGMVQWLTKYIAESDKMVGMWELRQFPFEHPKYYNPITLETTWCSGAAFVIRRKIFEAVGGFDRNFFMYAEDVDLSWRVRAAGYTIIYCPNALIRHNSYCVKGEIKPLQYGYSMRNNLLMRRRYGTRKDVLAGWCLVVKLLLTNRLGWSFNIRFLKIVSSYFEVKNSFIPLKNNRHIAFFNGLDYAKMRYGTFQESGLIGAKKQRLMTFILNDTDDSVLKLEKCIKNETFPSEIVEKISSLEQIAKRLDYYVESANIWVNIVSDDKLIFADHNEFLLSMTGLDYCVVGSVNQLGQKEQDMSYYLFNIDFYKSNRQYFIDNDVAYLVEKLKKYSFVGGKQTVI